MSRAAQAQAVIVGLGVVIVGALLAGCSETSTGPSADSTASVRDLHIDGTYYYVPGTQWGGMVSGAMIAVRRDSSGGQAVSSLAVRVNGHALAFDDSLECYTGVVMGLTAGGSMTISVSNGLQAISQAVQIPGPPTDFRLASLGCWDMSSAATTNTLVWDNPAILGDDSLVYVYEYDAPGVDLIYWSTLGDPQATSATVANSDLEYYEGISSLVGFAAQGNRMVFPDNPDSSVVWVLACVPQSFCVVTVPGERSGTSHIAGLSGEPN